MLLHTFFISALLSTWTSGKEYPDISIETSANSSELVFYKCTIKVTERNNDWQDVWICTCTPIKSRKKSTVASGQFFRIKRCWRWLCIKMQWFHEWWPVPTFSLLTPLYIICNVFWFDKVSHVSQVDTGHIFFHCLQPMGQNNISQWAASQSGVGLCTMSLISLFFFIWLHRRPIWRQHLNTSCPATDTVEK